MDSEKWDTFSASLRELYEKDSHIDEFNDEIPTIKYILEKIEEDLEGSFKIIEPLGMGGAGVVIKIRDKSLDYFRALKIPRPREPELIDSTRKEIDYLKQIRHENVIDLFFVGEVISQDKDQKFPYFVMDYVEGASDLKKNILDTLSSTNSGSAGLRVVTSWIANVFYNISKALEFLHGKNIIHFDVKPTNILIGQNGKPLLSDLGFAKMKSNNVAKVRVGYSFPYAHPSLLIEYDHKSSENRVRKQMAPKDFKFAFDIYAFGKSLLEILYYIANRYSDLVVYNYDFVYLHLAACRMLDGQNINDKQLDDKKKQLLKDNILPAIYKEEWIGIQAYSFNEIKYSDFKQIKQDLEKLLYGRHFLESVTELNTFFPKRVQCSVGTPAPFSKRVKLIIEHPVFTRLSSVPQLGILMSTYPTATHTRLEHSLGTFRNCCLYIQSLYNDQYNPLFKQLINEKDIKCILVASLVHDIGQYPLAHEIEEINEKFIHEKIGVEFLSNNTKNSEGHTLKDIIEKEWGWGVKIEQIKEIIEKDDRQHELWKKSFKVKLLRSIIDGPIDADKLDYLIRDSQNCFLKYGELIDFDRLIRNLTLIVSIDDYNKLSLKIGVYEKGQSAAESITFARYLLYQSLYWHRTARAVRAMLRYVLKNNMIVKPKSKKKNFYDELRILIGVENSPRRVDIFEVLGLIKKWAQNEGVDIINMIIKRQYYKRIATIHDDQEPPAGRRSFIQEFRVAHKKAGFNEALRNKIMDSFIDYTRNRVTDNSYFQMDDKDKIIQLLSKPYSILSDCPDPSYGGTELLNIIPEPQRLYKNYFSRVHTGETASTVWNNIYFKLMNIAAKARVFCHPDIRNSLMATIGLDGLKLAVKEAVRPFAKE